MKSMILKHIIRYHQLLMAWMDFPLIYQIFCILQKSMDCSYPKVALTRPEITLKVLEYLEEDSLTKKAVNFVKGIKETMEITFQQYPGFYMEKRSSQFPIRRAEIFF